MKIKIKDLKQIIESELKNYTEAENLMKDPIGGMVRPDQLEILVVDTLSQCILMAKQKNFQFSSLLKLAARRTEALSELYEDLDDEDKDDSIPPSHHLT